MEIRHVLVNNEFTDEPEVTETAHLPFHYCILEAFLTLFSKY